MAAEKTWHMLQAQTMMQKALHANSGKHGGATKRTEALWRWQAWLQPLHIWRQLQISSLKSQLLLLRKVPLHHACPGFHSTTLSFSFKKTLNTLSSNVHAVHLFSCFITSVTIQSFRKIWVGWQCSWIFKNKQTFQVKDDCFFQVLVYYTVLIRAKQWPSQSILQLQINWKQSMLIWLPGKKHLKLQLTNSILQVIIFQ